jgi:hypothetical protein
MLPATTSVAGSMPDELDAKHASGPMRMIDLIAPNGYFPAFLGARSMAPGRIILYDPTVSGGNNGD